MRLATARARPAGHASGGGQDDGLRFLNRCFESGMLIRQNIFWQTRRRFALTAETRHTPSAAAVNSTTRAPSKITNASIHHRG